MTDVTDSAQKRANELGVDLAQVEGSGQDGRILVSDVEAYSGTATGTSAESKEGQSEGSAIVNAVLNKDTQLGGYAFSDGFSVVPGTHYQFSEDEFKQYSKAKYNGVQVLKKA